MKLFCITTLILICNILFSQNKTENIFSWIEGNWKLNSTSELSFENWTIVNDSTLSGKSILISENDTVAEILRIERIGKNWVYIATVNQSKPVLFSLIENANNVYEFENKEHDFPQKIVYKLIQDDLLLVWIEGFFNQKFNKIEFEFSKK